MLQEAQKEALALADRLHGHSLEEKRIIVTGYMCGFMHANLLNEAHRKTEKMRENVS